MLGLLFAIGHYTIALAARQDDARGYWSDTFTDATGISSSVDTVVDVPNERVVLDGVNAFAYSDWSGGSGLDVTTVPTDRYLEGQGVDVTAAGALRLGATMRAGSTLPDLNGDGYPDLFFSNYFSGIEGGGGTRDTESYLYYGSSTGFSTSNRLNLPAWGGNGAAVADLNDDGYLDIVICEYTEAGSHIYWGSADGYSETNRTLLDADNVVAASAADLDADGDLDLVLAVVHAHTYAFQTNSYIYWNVAGGFSNTNRSPLPTIGAMSTFVVDLDQDGYLDIIFGNYRTNLSLEPSTFMIDSYIYWGSSTGYSEDNRDGLPTVGVHGTSVADLDDDGYLDIVFSNRHTAVDHNYVYNIDSYVYWGSASGYSAADRTSLPTLGAYGNSVADLNNDGYLDIVFANHQSAEHTHTVDSYIYWGSASGYSTASRNSLPTLGAAGVVVGDLNQDGYPDITFSNRRNGADHDQDSYVYWGSDGGYSTANRTGLPTHGALGVVAVGSQLFPGNTAFGSVYAEPITDSTTIADAMITPAVYPAAGVLTSAAFDAGSTQTWASVVWHTTIPDGTGIMLELATSNDNVTWSGWQVIAAESVTGTNTMALSLPDARYIRYRATLSSSSNHRLTPTLYDVELRYDYAPSGSVTSAAVTPAILNGWDVVTWTVALEPGHEVSVQVLDDGGSVLPDSVLPGNEAGFTGGTADLSSLDPGIYPALALRAVLARNSEASSPALEAWGLSWFAAPASLSISPNSSSLTAGTTQSYAVTAYDGYGKVWDATSSASFAIMPEAGGSWASNVYTSERAGSWVVTATLQGVEVTAVLEVSPAAMASVRIDTAAAGSGEPVDDVLVRSGDTLTVWGASYDAYDNHVADISLTWSGTGVVEGQLAPTRGFSTTFSASTIGEGTIHAEYVGGFTDDTGTITVIEPTAVTLISFTAGTEANGVRLAWETASEIDVLGFHLYRSHVPGTLGQRLTPELLPCQHPGMPLGAAYSWLDSSIAPRTLCVYTIEVIDTSGRAALSYSISFAPYAFRTYLPLLHR
ncbi:MAG: VCBS repeat-containing protein [Anaerolineae bacterium]|nr:VCBS repeat-containing protein [Anaerolineae bacterium]